LWDLRNYFAHCRVSWCRNVERPSADDRRAGRLVAEAG